MRKILTGGCCCGSVAYTLEDQFSSFYFCHCEQCRKMTGSAHASNLFTSPENITWLHGQDQLKRYDDPVRSFTQVFCTACGSALPYQSKSGKSLVVPAGSLNDEPSKKVDARIFCSEQTAWHRAGLNSPEFDKFPG
ncbi:GFA family protein [Photobacterium sp. CCB-ST2H9]|uniref:GFA family protein n=1 Tax=Photobacterium sp. CCB-ST2H9 TaxID=2912855 RepID=UPI0020059AF0|nr:GFA family protein [Photobacterium sp. CCB-ST2H9]UTM56074.1 GFA family protein [Photobacterium sp. CCB-ST2H9]